MPLNNPTSLVNPNVRYFTANLAQAAGTYDLCTSVGTTIIKSVSIFNDVAGAGLTSVAIASNNTTPDVVSTAVLLAALTGGKTLTGLLTPFTLLNSKKIQYTIVGIGSAGTLIVGIEIMGGLLV